MVNTYLAASAAVFSSSPSQKGIFSESLSWDDVNEGIRALYLGRNLSLTLRYLGHIIRKCFSSARRDFLTFKVSFSTKKCLQFQKYIMRIFVFYPHINKTDIGVKNNTTNIIQIQT